MSAPQEHWMVRTTANEITGPFSREHIIAEIRGGRLGPQDEVCEAKAYWIYLEEAEEVKKQLGIELPKSIHRDEEATETEIDTLTEELSIPQGGSPLPELMHEPSMDDGSTKVFSRAKRPEIPRPAAEMQPLILGHVERPSIWRVVASALIILTGALVAWVIRLLQISH